MKKKEEIIFATYELFAEKGYSLSISELAKKVKLCQSSIYSHFKGKDELIMIMIHQAMDYYYINLKEKVKIASEKTSCEEKLKFVYLSILNFYNDDYVVRFRAHILGISNEKIRTETSLILVDLEKKIYDEISVFFKEGIENKEIQTQNLVGTFHLFIFMIQGIVDSIIFYPEKDENRERYIAKTWEAFWNGISLKK